MQKTVLLPLNAKYFEEICSGRKRCEFRNASTNYWRSRLKGATHVAFQKRTLYERGSCFSPNSLLLGVLNALKNGRLGGLVGFPAGLSPTSFHLSPSSFHLSPKLLRLGACGWVPGSAGLSPTSFHLSPTSFHLSPSSFHLSPRLGACGRVPGWLVSHFLSFVSQFFSFVSQAGCLWVGFPAGLSPTSFHLFPTSFISLLLGVLNALKNGRLGFPAGVSPTSFHLSPTSFHLSPSSFHLSPRLGACGRVPAGVSPTSFHLFPISFDLSPTTFHLSSTSFHVSPSSCLSPTAFHLFPLLFICLPLSFICLLLLFICLPPRLGACGRVPALFRWPCSISIRLSPRSVTAGVRPSPLAM